MDSFYTLPWTLSSVLCAVALMGCAAGPDFERPASPDVSGYLATPMPVRTTSAPVALGGSQQIVDGVEVDTHWWRKLGSNELNALIKDALENNPDLEATEAAVRQAQEQYAAKAGATRIPQLEGGLIGQRQRMSPGAVGQPVEMGEYSLYDTSISVHYTFDLTGGNRRALEALAARSNYETYRLAGARLTLAANVASAAITDASLSGQIEVLEAITRSQHEQLEIDRARVRLGRADQDEVRRLQTQIENNRAQISALRNLHEHNEHMLAVLVGRPPAAGELPRFSLGDFNLPTELPLIVPSELVRMRPDILAAEALLHAANAEYGVAVSNLYPQITISADIGSQALSGGTLFGGGSAVWSLVGQLTQPLFKPGLPAERRAALAAFHAAAANYQSVVLESLRGVADVLRALEYDARRLAALRAAEVASQASQDSESRRHMLGASSYYELLVAQQRTQQIAIERVAAQAKRLTNSIAFYQAVAGVDITVNETVVAQSATDFDS